ncbi:hypothetical protein HHI36_008001 [Cryptolaemus montrouzieri]|uniref:Uncharacterized protein n=1 Tax=Cryptolaemus montrouzieri TaxID=559131 RepID=A0ABD2MR53_9CUCU
MRTLHLQLEKKSMKYCHITENIMHHLRKELQKFDMKKVHIKYIKTMDDLMRHENTEYICKSEKQSRAIWDVICKEERHIKARPASEFLTGNGFNNSLVSGKDCRMNLWLSPEKW